MRSEDAHAMSEPIRSEFGYHIIQAQARSVKTLAEAKDAILAQLKPVVARKEGEAMLAQTPYKIDDAYFGPAPAPLAAAPAPAPAR